MQEVSRSDSGAFFHLLFVESSLGLGDLEDRMPTIMEGDLEDCMPRSMERYPMTLSEHQPVNYELL